MATDLIKMPGKSGLTAKFAERFDIDPANVMAIVASTVFKQSKDEAPLTNDEVQAAMIVCNQYDLNPFLKEIFVFRSKGKLLLYVSIDGWCKVINRQENLDGIEFDEKFDEKGKIVSVTCRIHRKDRRLPVVVTEYFAECSRPTDPWSKSPIRMTRHRALIQCARVAFSISGIMDEEEAQEMLPAGFGNGPLIDAPAPTGSATSSAKITQDEARAFGKAWKESGRTMEEAKAFLKSLNPPVTSSLEITSTVYPKVMDWANKRGEYAPKEAPAEVELSQTEKDIEMAYQILDWTDKEISRFTEQYGGDTEKILAELNILVAKRESQE